MTVYLKGEGGVVWAHDEPLHPDIEDGIRRGRLQRVNQDGSPPPESVQDEQAVGTDQTAVVSEDTHTLEELKAAAVEVGVPVSGTKAELVDRINTAVAEQPDGPAAG